MALASGAIEWKGDKFVAKYREAAADASFEAALALRDQLMVNLSVLGGDGEHSAPYDYPYLQSGELRDSVKVSVNRKTGVGRVVVLAKHALPLEMGTSRMKPRPFMRRTMNEMKGELRKIMEDTIARGGARRG